MHSAMRFRWLACLVLALFEAVTGTGAVPCSTGAISSTAARFPGVQFRGRNSSFSCGTADNYEECYRECGCWRTRNQCSPPPPPSPADAPPSPPPAPAAPCGNAPEVACNYVVFSPNDTRCAADGSQNMCVYLSTVTGADAAPALQSGIYGNVDRFSLDESLGYIGDDLAGTWLDADASMLLNNGSCNYIGGDYTKCQLQCLQDARCVGWMFGPNPDPQCSPDPVTGQIPAYDPVTFFGCIDKPLQGVNGYGCKAGACLLYSGFFNVTVTQSNPSGRALPGQMVGVIPGRTNPYAAQANPAALGVVVTLGDMYEGEIADGTGLSNVLGAGYSLADAGFDYGTPVNDTACDVNGTCALSLDCDLYVTSAAACAELCKATNEQIGGQSSRLAGLSDIDPLVLATPLPTCQFYRWTEQPVSCGGAGMKKGVCLLVSSVAALRSRTSEDDTLNVTYGTMSMSNIPSPPPPPPPPTPSPPPPQPSPPPPQPSPPPRPSPPPPKPSPPPPLPSPPPRPSPPPAPSPPSPRPLRPSPPPPKPRQSSSSPPPPQRQRNPPPAPLLRAPPSLRPPVMPRPSPPPPLRRTNQPAERGRPRGLLQAAEPAACKSTFFSLPKLVVAGATHLAAFDGGDEGAALRAFALQYCQQRNSSFGAAGALRRGVLPRVLSAHAAALSTYSPLSGAVCEGGGCPFIAVLECVPQGAQPCAEDEAGNVGIGNRGSGNVGHYNIGSNNLGSRNTGDHNVGDMNTASGCMGSFNSAHGSFGYAGSGSLAAPATQQ